MTTPFEHKAKAFYDAPYGDGGTRIVTHHHSDDDWYCRYGSKHTREAAAEWILERYCKGLCK